MILLLHQKFFRIAMKLDLNSIEMHDFCCHSCSLFLHLSIRAVIILFIHDTMVSNMKHEIETVYWTTRWAFSKKVAELHTSAITYFYDKFLFFWYFVVDMNNIFLGCCWSWYRSLFLFFSSIKYFSKSLSSKNIQSILYGIYNTLLFRYNWICPWRRLFYFGIRKGIWYRSVIKFALFFNVPS